MANKPQRTVIKKVKAYPIPLTIDIKGQKKPAEIVKLAPVGCWANVSGHLIHVGLIYNLEFDIPVVNATVVCSAKALRTMDKINEAGKAAERLAEFQFIKLPDEARFSIQKFLTAINQTSY